MSLRGKLTRMNVDAIQAFFVMKLVNRCSVAILFNLSAVSRKKQSNHTCIMEAAQM